MSRGDYNDGFMACQAAARRQEGALYDDIAKCEARLAAVYLSADAMADGAEKLLLAIDAWAGTENGSVMESECYQAMQRRMMILAKIVDRYRVAVGEHKERRP